MATSLPALTSAGASEDSSTSVHAPLCITPPSLQAPRADGFEAIWAVRTLCRGRIEWEAEDGTRGNAATDPFGFTPQGARLLRVRVGGLRPGLRYQVRAHTAAAEGTRSETSDWREFRTLNPAASGTHFAVWNDTHVQNPTLEKLDAVTPAVDFLIWNGDTCNDWTREELLVPTLLHPAGRDITRGRPLQVIWGNHDVRGPWAFAMPSLIATPTGRPFHAFRSGPVAVVCLHTGEDKPDAHPSFGGRVAFEALRAEQAAWLDTVLQQPDIAQAPYRVVVCHIPLRWLREVEPDYAQGGFDHFSGRSRAAWNKALVRWGAQVILSGHTHHHAWIPADATFPYGQLVGGGPQPAAATWIEAVADAQALRLVVRDLAGLVLHEVRLAPLARA